jgi:hypothetical protein
MEALKLNEMPIFIIFESRHPRGKRSLRTERRLSPACQIRLLEQEKTQRVAGSSLILLKSNFSVPEPSTALLTGFSGIYGLLRRRRQESV